MPPPGVGEGATPSDPSVSNDGDQEVSDDGWQVPSVEKFLEELNRLQNRMNGPEGSWIEPSESEWGTGFRSESPTLEPTPPPKVGEGGRSSDNSASYGGAPENGGAHEICDDEPQDSIGDHYQEEEDSGAATGDEFQEPTDHGEHDDFAIDPTYFAGVIWDDAVLPDALEQEAEALQQIVPFPLLLQPSDFEEDGNNPEDEGSDLDPRLAADEDGTETFLEWTSEGPQLNQDDCGNEAARSPPEVLLRQSIIATVRQQQSTAAAMSDNEILDLINRHLRQGTRDEVILPNPFTPIGDERTIHNERGKTKNRREFEFLPDGSGKKYKRHKAKNKPRKKKTEI